MEDDRKPFASDEWHAEHGDVDPDSNTDDDASADSNTGDDASADSNTDDDASADSNTDDDASADSNTDDDASADSNTNSSAYTTERDWEPTTGPVTEVEELDNSMFDQVETDTPTDDFTKEQREYTEVCTSTIRDPPRDQQYQGNVEFDPDPEDRIFDAPSHPTEDTDAEPSVADLEFPDTHRGLGAATENSQTTDTQDDDTEDSEARKRARESGPTTYIKITPVRADVSDESIIREWYGMHNLASGRGLPFGLDAKLPRIESLSSFEFLIHKPEDEAGFDFYIGIDDDDKTDRVESNIRSQYPEDFEFETKEFSIFDQFEETPHITRWDGIEDKRKDWMGLLAEYNNYEGDRSPISNLLETMVRSDEELVFQAVFEPRSNWTNKAERRKRQLKVGVNSMGGLAMQQFLDRILGVSQYERRQRHKGDTPGEVGGSIGDSEPSGARRKSTRMSQIDIKQPATTYNMSLRLAGDDPGVIQNATASLNHLSGQFYSVDGNYLGQHTDEFRRMILSDITDPTAWQTISKRKPKLVANPEELANFTTVPGMDNLPKASRGATGGRPQAQAPLTSPDEQTFQEFGHDVWDIDHGGMCIGKAATAHESEQDPVDSPPQESHTDYYPDWGSDPKTNDWWNEIERKESIHLKAKHLTQHYIRAATTGSGKTVATINDVLTAHHYLDGPVILIDPKGGDMFENYLRSHHRLFGDTEDIEYIKIPEKNQQVPGMPFFDIRPLVGAGKPRNTAIQDKLDHYREMLRHILGEQTFEQAFVANEILINLIKALFEPTNYDNYTIQDLLELTREYRSKEGFFDYIPDDDEPEESHRHTSQADQHPRQSIQYTELEGVEPDFPQPKDIDTTKDEHKQYAGIETMGDYIEQFGEDYVKSQVLWIDDESTRTNLEDHSNKGDEDFLRHTDAVLNRITKLKERDFIWNILNQDVEEWDEERNWYDRDAQVIDLADIIDSNKVVLIDTGDLRSESSEIFSVLFLSYIWTTVTSVDPPDDDNHVTNVIIEESAAISRTRIVYEELLPRGREFNLSLGLIMQYPEQVLGKQPTANEHVYREVLNNINTKIIGNIAMDDALADALFHEGLETEEIKDRIQGLPRGEWVVQLPPSGFQQKKPELLTLKPLPISPTHHDSDDEFPEVFPEFDSNEQQVRERTREEMMVDPDTDRSSRDSRIRGEGPGHNEGNTDGTHDATQSHNTGQHEDHQHSSQDEETSHPSSPDQPQTPSNGQSKADTNEGDQQPTTGTSESDASATANGGNVTFGEDVADTGNGHQDAGTGQHEGDTGGNDQETDSRSEAQRVADASRGHEGEIVHQYDPKVIDRMPRDPEERHLQFMDRLMQALNGDLRDHHPIDSMDALQGHDELAEELVEMDYLNRVTIGNMDQWSRTYYTFNRSAPIGELYQTLRRGSPDTAPSDSGDGTEKSDTIELDGDLGEGVMHRLMVKFVENYLELHDKFVRPRSYLKDQQQEAQAGEADYWEDAENEGGQKEEVLDVYAMHESITEPPRVIEVEMRKQYPGKLRFQFSEILGDLVKLAKKDGRSVWVVRDREAVRGLIKTIAGGDDAKVKKAIKTHIDDPDLREKYLALSEEGHTNGLISPIQEREMRQMDTVDLSTEIDIPGFDAIVVFSDLFQVIARDTVEPGEDDPLHI